MILIDMSNIFFISMHASYEKKYNPEQEFNEPLIRHLVLESIRQINVKFRDKYGRIVIACDGRNSWRKDVFPFYKAHRKKDREKLQHIDWPAVFKLFDSLKDELRHFTGYMVIEPASGEGDDVIGTLALKDPYSRHMVVSTDKDYKQLFALGNVEQYNPIDKTLIEVEDPNDFLFELIARGDVGDGVPNILSDDDTFVKEEKRQKRMTKGIMESLKNTDASKWDNERHRINWNRNKKLIDLREAPEYVQEDILSQYQTELNKKPKGIFNYFVAYQVTGQLDKIADFKERA